MSTWEARQLLSPSPTFLIAAALKVGPSQLSPLLPLRFQEKQPPAALVSPKSPQTSPSCPLAAPLLQTLFLRLWWGTSQ